MKSKNKGFIKQAGILALAGIISRIIGALYRSPLFLIIGAEGNGYYSIAYNIYTILLLLSSYSIPTAISKLISQRLALKEYKNAHRILRCSIIYVIVIGSLTSLVTFLGSDIFVDQNSAKVLKFFAPTIFLSGLLGVLRGYFQAHKTMLSTSISQIVEQLSNAIISILAAYLLVRMVASESAKSVYGAIGSAIGTGSGVIIAFVFMLIIYYINKPFFYSRMEKDTSTELLSNKQIYKIIIFMVTPVILSTFIYNFSTSLNQTLYIRIMQMLTGYSVNEITTLYGIFAGNSMVIANIPIALSSAMSMAIIPTISSSFAKGNISIIKMKLDEAIKTTMLIIIPAAVGLAVLAKPVMLLLFHQWEHINLASNLLKLLTISILFYSLSTLSNAVLQSIGEVKKPIRHAAISLIIQTLILVSLLFLTNLSLYSLAIAAIVYSFSMFLLNEISIRRILGYQIEIVKSLLLPLLTSAIMGVITYLTYNISYSLMNHNTPSLIISISCSMLVYLILIIRLRLIGEKELRMLPKGQIILVLAMKLKLM